MGIEIFFYSKEHEPIHIHAKYNESIIRVSFFIKENEIYKTTYTEVFGSFPKNKLNTLKKFISEYKYEIVKSWIDFFIMGGKPKVEKITKKI
jgi:hypothetical protein